MNPFLRFLAAARSLANQGMSKEAIEQFAKNEFGKINTLMQKQINNIFKPSKPVGKKDEVFDSTVEKMQFDDQGKPFNPRNPTKDYSKKAEGGIMRVGLKLGTNELRQMAMEMFGKDDLRLLSKDELDQLREAFDIKKGRVEEADGGRAGFVAGGITNLAIRLARGFMKVTGKKPNDEEILKIIQEAAEKDFARTVRNVEIDSPLRGVSETKATIRRMDSVDKDELKKAIDEYNFAQGGRAGFKDGLLAKIMPGVKPDGGLFKSVFANRNAPFLSAFNTAELFDLVSNLSSLPGLAKGGRIGYKDGPEKPGRRKFMKMAAGIASLIPGLGMIGKGAKVAAPVVAKAAEITGPALDKIVDTVMSLGKFVSLKGKRVKDMVTKKKHEGVEVTEDVADQSYIIKKDGKEIYYKPGRMDETGGIEDDIIEVIEDRVKKAGGGIGYMLGE